MNSRTLSAYKGSVICIDSVVLDDLVSTLEATKERIAEIEAKCED